MATYNAALEDEHRHIFSLGRFGLDLDIGRPHDEARRRALELTLKLDRYVDYAKESARKDSVGGLYFRSDDHLAVLSRALEDLHPALEKALNQDLQIAVSLDAGLDERLRPVGRGTGQRVPSLTVWAGYRIMVWEVLTIYVWASAALDNLRSETDRLFTRGRGTRPSPAIRTRRT